MVYEGLSLAPRIARGLDALLARDGFANVAAAVGTGRGDWL
jgi:dihydroorotate dehydrogenase